MRWRNKQGRATQRGGYSARSGALPAMRKTMIESPAEILREYGPFPGADHVHGVTFDGQHVWFASGDKLTAFDPERGKMVRSLNAAAPAGAAVVAQHLFHIAAHRIPQIDPKPCPV